MARPTKCTPQTIELICKAVELGATYKFAAEYAGISEESFRTWMRKGENGQKPYAGFLGELKKAEARGVITHLANMHKAAKDGTWQASAWILERRHPAEYGRHLVEVKHTHVKPAAEMSDDELAAEIMEIADAIRSEHAQSKTKKKAKA